MRRLFLGGRRIATVPLIAALGLVSLIVSGGSPCFGQPTLTTRNAGTAVASGRRSAVRSLADLSTHNLTADLQALVAWTYSIPAQTGGSGPVTLAEALASARARRDLETTAAQRAALAASPLAQSARSLQGAAAAAIAGGRPAAALSAMLLAQERAQKDPTILVNLAGLLARLGMPREALALLDAADRLPGELPSPMGINGHAIALNNRGYALLLLKRWADAEPPLRQAMGMAPLLSEAATNLAVALAGQGKEDEAKRVLYFGVWRSRGPVEAPGARKVTPVAEEGTPATPQTPAEVPASLLNTRLHRPISEAFDLSAGLGTNLPAIKHPVNSAEVVGMDAMLRRRTAKWSPVRDDISQRYIELKRQLRTQPDSLSKRRAERILVIMTGLASYRDAEMQALVEATRRVKANVHAQEVSEGQLLSRKRQGLVTSHTMTPENMTRIHNEYVDHMHQIAVRLEGAMREEWSTEYQRLTGLAANLSDPRWHELAVLHIKGQEGAAYNALIAGVHGAYASGAYIPRTDRADAEDPAERNIPSCPASLRKQGLDAELALFSVKFSCEKVEVSVSTEGWLAGFAKAEFGIRGRHLGDGRSQGHGGRGRDHRQDVGGGRHVHHRGQKRPERRGVPGDVRTGDRGGPGRDADNRAGQHGLQFRAERSVEPNALKTWTTVMEKLTPIYTAELFPPLHAELIHLLRTLDEGDWIRPTLAAPWRIRDVAAHLLDGDLRKLAGGRDGHRLAGRASSFEDIVRLINGLNAGGVDYMQRLSPRVLTDLLEVTGRWVSEYVGSLPPHAASPIAVAWADEESSENWMDTGREYTERWHHQMQIRDAAGAAGLLDRRWLYPLLDLSVRAFRRTYKDVTAEAGTIVTFEVDADGDNTWSVVRDPTGWTVVRGRAPEVAACVRCGGDTAWKILFNVLTPDAARARVSITGDPALAEPMLRTRSVMV